MSDAAIWALFVIVLINTLFILGIAVALMILDRKVSDMTEMARPLVNRVNETLTKVEGITGQLGERVNQFLDQTGRLVEDVTQKVETTTSMAEETITQPLISAASWMAGLSHGWDTYKAQSAREKGDSQQ